LALILYTVALIVLASAGIVWAAERINLPSPILLLIGGITVSLVPAVPVLRLEPDLVLLVLLPPLIYFAAFRMSWQAFRANLRPILLLAIGCVLFTTVAVAGAAAWALSFPLGVAFMLGAIVSPPDVVAPLAVAERLRLPQRVTHVLEGEGLVNDATALVLFNVALFAVQSGGFSLLNTVGSFLIILAGETLWGLLVGFVILRLRALAKEPRVELTLSVLTPFIAFWAPHASGGSGVLATVVAGLYVGYAGTTLIPSNTRLQATFFWDFSTTLITAVIFFITGLEAREVVAGLDGASLAGALGSGLLISLVVIVVRFVWVFPATYLPRHIVPGLAQRDPSPSWRPVFAIAFTGVRGVVSLAAALSVPLTLGGGPFPERDEVLVITFTVIVVTLVAQGLTLPWLVRRLGLVEQGRAEQAEGSRRETAARAETARAALLRLDELEDESFADHTGPIRKRFQTLIADLLDGGEEMRGQGSISRVETIELALIETERTRLNQLTDAGDIGDDIRRRIERDLDLAEEKLRRNLRGISG
jgi:monovalent cation/hydrogen antiporter